MRLIIHAGIHRTGSTALQYFLADNRTELALQGFAYPFDKPNHQDIAWALHRHKTSGDDLIARLHTLNRSTAHTVILSGEDFSLHQNLDWLDVVSRDYNVECIVYLRRQDDWVMSWYNQHVKWPFNREKSQASPQEFLSAIDEFYWIDYERLLDRWTGALGFDSVTVGVVEKQQITDVVRHFADAVGLDTAPMTFGEARPNDSLPIHVLEIARHLGLFEMTRRERTVLNNALRTALLDKATDATTVYSPAERAALIERFAKTNRAVAQRFFGRDELFKAPIPGPDEAYYTFPATRHDEVLKEWVAPLLRQLIARAK